MLRYLKYGKILTLLFFIGLTLNISAQNDQFSIKGKVLGEGGQPVSDVSVSIEGRIGSPALTDSTGEFELNTPDGNVWLLITPVGNYNTKRVFLNQREDLIIVLVPGDRSSLYDEIPTLNGTKAHRDIIGSHEDISLDAIFEQPDQTISQYLSGQARGLLSYNYSGMPGDGTYTFMRGIRSLHTNNQPLVISDGMPLEVQGIFKSLIEGYHYDPLTSVNPQDITSLTILSDAEGTANYGVKSSNGLILIETLKPTETQTTIDVGLRSGFSLASRQIPVLDANQYRTLAHEILITSGYAEEEFEFLFPGLTENPITNENYRYIHNTNWQDEVFSNASLLDFGLSIKGGDAISKYGLSVNYQDYEGIIKNTNFNRINLRFVGSFNVFKWLEMYISTSLSNNSSMLKETGNSTSTSPLLTALFKSPAMAPYQFDEAGEKLSFLDDVDAFGVSNPTAVITKSKASNRNFKFLGTFSLIGNITKEIKWNSLLGLNFGNMKESIFLPNDGMELYLGQEGYNEVRQQSANIQSFYLDNFLKYNKDFDGKNRFSTRLGIRTNTNHSELDYGIGNNTPSDEYTSLRFAQSIFADIGGEMGSWNWMSIYGNVDYTYKDKYLLGLNISVDGSSRTGKDAETAMRLFDHPFGLFYSINGAWRVSGEPFLRNISQIDELKLRVSFGLTGNDDIGNYTSRRYYSQVKYRETTGVILGTKPITNLKFESNQMLDIGLDLSIFGERLNLIADYFSVITRDMLIFERQEDYIGYAFRPTNGGEVKNTGFEVGIYSRLIDAGYFKFDAGVNVSHYKNQVLSIKGGSLVTPILGGEILSRPGDPVNSFYGYVAEGVFSTSVEASESGLVNEIGLPFQAGDVKFRDISGPDGSPDHVINEFDKTIIGSANPDLYGGLTLVTTFKRWSLRTVIQFITGNETYNYLRFQTEKMTDLHNQTTSVLNRWQYEGQETDMPRASWNDPMGNSAFSSRWIEDGSYIRGKNITLVYKVPEKFLVFRNASFFASATNIFTITKYLGYDPEFMHSSDQLLLGVDSGVMPQSKTFLIGLKLGI